MGDSDADYIVVLCSDCHLVPLTARTKMGVAKTWDGLLICDTCAQKWIDRQQANIQVPPKV